MHFMKALSVNALNPHLLTLKAHITTQSYVFIVAIKTLFLASFDPRSSMVKSVFDCSLSGVETNFFQQKHD